MCNYHVTYFLFCFFFSLLLSHLSLSLALSSLSSHSLYPFSFLFFFWVLSSRPRCRLVLIGGYMNYYTRSSLFFFLSLLTHPNLPLPPPSPLRSSISSPRSHASRDPLLLLSTSSLLLRHYLLFSVSVPLPSAPWPTSPSFLLSLFASRRHHSRFFPPLHRVYHRFFPTCDY